MPKEICNRLDTIEREIQMLLLLQTASARIPAHHECDSSDSNDVIYCTPANCADLGQPNEKKSGHELASSNDECPCPPSVDDQRHDFLKKDVFVSVKTAKKQSRAAATNRKKTTVSCDIRRGGRYEQPERPCQDNCQGVCNPEEPQRDESCHAQCRADCTKMAAERDMAGPGQAAKVSSLEERCQLLEQQNAELHALLDSNRAQVRESVQSKELALAMARQLKEKNDALRAEKERLEKDAQPAQTGLPKSVTEEPTSTATPTSEATPDDATDEIAAVRQEDVGVFEDVVTQDASLAADAVPAADGERTPAADERARLAEERARELEDQWRAAEDKAREAEARARAAEERAKRAERRLDDMDKTCDCNGEGEALTDEPREEPSEFFDALEQPKTGASEINAADEGPPIEETTLTETSTTVPGKTASPTERPQPSGQEETLTSVLGEAGSQSERLKSLSQELQAVKSDSQKLKILSTMMIQLERHSQELEQEVAELKEENQQLFREASETAQECCAHAEEVSQLRTATEDLGRVLGAQEERINELQEINGMQEKLVLVQQQQMDTKEEQVRRANQDVEVIRRKSNDLDEQVQRLRTSIESFERVQTAGEERDGQEMKKARARIAELTAEVSRLRKAVDDYKRQLDDGKSTRSQSGPEAVKSMSDESCHCDATHHCPCLDDDGTGQGVASPYSVDAGNDADAEFRKFQWDAQQAKQEVELIRKRSSELGDDVLERSVRSIERLQTELQQEQRRSVEKVEAVTSHYRASLEKEQDKLLIKDKIVEDQAATILQLKELQKRLDRDLKESNQRAAQLLMQLKDAQRREKELTEQLRRAESEAETAECGCHEQLDAQDAALQELEEQVAVKQREWERKMRVLQKEKEAAIAAARFATVKLVEATNEFRRQLSQHKDVQLMLATAMAQRHAQLAQQKDRKISPRRCICSGDEDLPQPPQEVGLGASVSLRARRELVIQRSPSRSRHRQ